MPLRGIILTDRVNVPVCLPYLFLAKVQKNSVICEKTVKTEGIYVPCFDGLFACNGV